MTQFIIKMVHSETLWLKVGTLKIIEMILTTSDGRWIRHIYNKILAIEKKRAVGFEPTTLVI